MVKIKQVSVTANYAWSPAEVHPIYIAAGTAAQQLDATFSSNAKLELYTVDMSDAALEATCAGVVDTANRFQKVVWGPSYLDCSQSMGLIVCGTDKGAVEIFDPEKVLNHEKDCLVFATSKHTGPVNALDFNPFQKNLFASGASEREIFIWDMKNPGNPMTPGAKTQPIAPISAVAWNRQVQHILASTSAVTSGPCCVVWDLRKNEPIIKVQDPSGRMQCSDVSWHPEVATQLVLPSEDDHSPVVQLWDLRFATSPLKVLEKHRKGVMSVAWCPRDPDLLLSCGKDNHVYCWNPNSSPPEILYELETNVQWCFDVQWCPRNPNVVSTGSFDGRILIHSLMGGGIAVEGNDEEKHKNLVNEAFGSSGDSLAQPAAAANATKRKVCMPLKKPPKWMRKPCGASFVFGGRLVCFEHNPPTDPQQAQFVKRPVTVSQVVTESQFLQRSNELQAALYDNAKCFDYCQKKMENSQTEFDENIWSFLKVSFGDEPKKQYLDLLGYNAADLKKKFTSHLVAQSATNENADGQDSGSDGKDVNEDATGDDDAAVNGTDAFAEIAAATERDQAQTKPMPIPVADGDLDSMISQALLIGDFKAAVDLCLHGKRMADAIVTAIAGGPELLEKTQRRYFAMSESKTSRLLSAVVTSDWRDVVTSCDLENWKEALASLLTYANAEEMKILCDTLGARLETSEKYRSYACLCYICSGNIENLVRCWDAVKPEANDAQKKCDAVQELVEKMMILLRVSDINNQGRQPAALGKASADKLAEYASILAAQGQVKAALDILPKTSDKIAIQILMDRLYHSQGDAAPGGYNPPFPFAREGLRLGQRPEAQVQPRRQMAGGGYGQEAYAQRQPLPTSTVQRSYPQTPMQAPMQPLPQAHTSASVSQPSSNPFASNRAFQRQTYATSPQTPANLYTPQPAAPSSSVPGAAQIQPQQPSAPVYTPYSTAASNGPGYMHPLPSDSAAPILAAPPSSVPGMSDSTARRHTAGWNDPPPLDPNRIPRKKKATPQPLKPEELNLMTPTPQPVPSLPGLMQPGIPLSGYPQPSSHPGPIPQHINPVMRPGMMQNLQQNQAPSASVPTAAPKDIPKAPIPAEHQILRTQFDDLIKKCSAQASNAQMKRKLEDCTRRLEFLYDKLRTNSLNPNVVGGLHQVVQSISARDYGSGLRQHQHIVSHSNFSEISAFMPGVKIMLQIAQQLRI